MRKFRPRFTPVKARTADVLTVAPNASGFAPDAKITYVYVWRNGRRVLDNAGEALDLGEPGNGERGDTVLGRSDRARRQRQSRRAQPFRLVIGQQRPVRRPTVTCARKAASPVRSRCLPATPTATKCASPVPTARHMGVADVRKIDGEWKLFYTGYKGQTGDDEVEHRRVRRAGRALADGDDCD